MMKVAALILALLGALLAGCGNDDDDHHDNDHRDMHSETGTLEGSGEPGLPA